MMTMTRRQLMRMLPAAILAAVLPMRLTHAVEAAEPRLGDNGSLTLAEGEFIGSEPPYVHITIGDGSRQSRIVGTTAVIDVGDTSAWQANRWQGGYIDCFGWWPGSPDDEVDY